MTRELFLKLSQSAALRDFMERSPLARKINRRFIAGVTLTEGSGGLSRTGARGHLVDDGSSG
ncbi:MAG: hypothetical protein WDO18_12330 [Acidobacteriota bacterium]